jgi:predicted Zn-dependent protease
MVAGVVVTFLAATAVAQGTALDVSEVVTFYVARTDEGKPHPDAEFARWAFDAWSTASDGVLKFTETETIGDALIRVYWVGPNSRRYGQAQGIDVDGKRGAVVFINTSTDGLGDDIHSRAERDPLYRDSIVYLTCVHEIGHAVGLRHTNSFADIMYTFQYGGDIKRYFMRYRKKVENRGELAKLLPFSDNDIAHLRALYGIEP